MYHLLHSLKLFCRYPTGIYVYDQEEELSKLLSASLRLHHSTLKLLMCILDTNPYMRFFKELREIPNLEGHKIILNSNLGLD